MTDTLNYTSETTYELTRAHPDDAGLDLIANEDINLAPGSRHLTATGIRVELPAGTVGYITPRSGLAAKHGVTVTNAPGTVDAGYRGELKVNLVNLGKSAHYVAKGDRIAQLVIHPVLTPAPVRVDQFNSHTARGVSGHGSTGY